jgi:hypothetical protein
MLPFLDAVSRWVYSIAMILSGIVMVAMMGAGILESAVAVKLMYISGISHLRGVHGGNGGEGAIRSALSGIESIFLAPLAFLAIHCISLYIMQRLEAGREGGTRSVDDHSIVELKAWTLSLMIAIVATDLIGRLVGGMPFEPEPVFAESLVIVVLALVWWLVYGRREHATLTDKASSRAAC